jgi:hypothetical protein
MRSIVTRVGCTSRNPTYFLPLSQFKDLFLMEEEKSEFQVKMDMTVAQTRAEGVPPEKL